EGHGESGLVADLGQVGLQDADLALMLAYMANGNGERVVEIARERFIDKGDTRDGLYVLLSRFPNALVQTAAPDSTQTLSFDLRPSVEGSPLKQFVRQYVNWLRDTAAWHPGAGGISAFQIDAPQDSFLLRLATARNLYVRWLTDEATKDRTQAQVQQEVERTLEFIATCRTTEMGWTLMSVIRPRLTSAEHLTAFAKAAARFETHPQISLYVRRERITSLVAAGQVEEARTLFSEWLSVQLDQGFVPLIGAELYNSLIDSSDGQVRIDELLLKDARRLVEAEMLMTANTLAIQMRELGNARIADQIMALVLPKLSVANHPDLTLVAIEQFRRLKDPRADRLLDQVMELPATQQLPELWRFASKLAEESGRTRLAAERLETAIQLEFATRPTTINIETVRHDYTELLAKYGELIDASATLEISPPEGLVSRIIQAADQWRTLDEDDTAACQVASRLLMKLNSKDLAMDYLVTPLAENSGESAPWTTLARSLASEKQIDLADMAWTQAFLFEATNPEILLEHAQMLQAAGRTAHAKALLQRIDDNSWQPRFSNAVQQSRTLLQSL
ncbi:MAG TPA: hypothetical protein PLR25_22340, partial [Planctomycetaceae bacterium]|nr:hypothetical protein [Planctomycetaceae bacterium]